MVQSSFLVFCYRVWFLCSVYLALPVSTSASDAAKELQLRAASLTSDLTRRSLGVLLRHEVDLHYIEDAPSGTNAPFGAHVRVGSLLPMLLLEDIETSVKEVHCMSENQAIELKFLSNDQMVEVLEAVAPFDGYLLITSHWGCNDEGSRLPFIVRGPPSILKGNTLSLHTLEITWNDRLFSTKVDFGRDEMQYTLRPHQHLRRQSLFSSKPSPSLSSVPISSSIVFSTSLPFPTPDPSASPTATAISQDISWQAFNKQILPSENTLLADAEGLVLPPGLNISCLNCTTTGSIELLTGSFSMQNNVSVPNNSNDTSTLQFIEHGFVEVLTHNLSAHIALSTTWPVSAPVGKPFTINLASIPFTPFSIPDIAVVGPLFNPRLLLAATVSTDLDFTYGFAISVPDKASAIANIGNVSLSTITGFSDTTLSLLPFNAAVSNIALTLTATFQPEILIGISFLGGTSNAGAGLFLELPQLSLAIQPVTGTDDHCNPIANASLAQDITNRFGSPLINVVPALQLAGGFIAQATLGPAIHNFSGQTAYTPLATTFAGPTTCLGFDAKGKNYVPATATPTVAGGASGTGSANAGASSTGAASGMRVERAGDWYGQQTTLVVLLVMVGGGFVAL